MMSQKKYQTNNYKVLLNSVPMPGHYLPIVHIANVLAKQRNIQLTFSTSGYEFENLRLNKKIKKLELHDNNQEKKYKANYKEIPVNDYDQPWQPELRSFVQKQKPAVLVCDFFSLALMKIGHQLKIPTIIHIPTSTGVLHIMDYPMLQKNISLFGFTILTNKSFFYPKPLQPMIKLGKYLDNSLVLVSSFFGLDHAKSLPPNVRMIGSTYCCQTDQTRQIQDDLRNWVKDKKDIVYVGFGSFCKLAPNFINFLYNGLKKIGNPVIWSLKNQALPEQNQNFFIHKCLPQEQILQIDQVKLVITNCGWSSVLQCITSQKPILCIPIFGDQPQNSKLILKKQIGLILHQKTTKSIMPQTLQSPNFTHQQLQTKIHKLLTQQHYKKNLSHLHKLMSQTGGVQQAAQFVRNAAQHGIQHLVDRDVIKIRQRSIRVFVMFMMMFVVWWVVFGRVGGRGEKVVM